MGVRVVTLAHGDLELSIVPEYGARLHALRLRGQDMLRTPDDLAMHEREPFFWGAFTMAPWGNRATTERITVAGRALHLRPNFEDGSAIHGQVYVLPWQQVDESVFRIEHRGHGWPWPYEVRLLIQIDASRARLSQRLTNLSDSPMPAGMGIHPWFAGQPEIAIHSGLAYRSNTNPDTRPAPVTGPVDLRQRTAMAKGVDATWADPGDPAAELWWPDGRHLAIRVLTATPHIVAANLPGIDAIAVESETHAPPGLGRLLDGEPGGVTLLDPGSMLTLTTILEFASVR